MRSKILTIIAFAVFFANSPARAEKEIFIPAEWQRRAIPYSFDRSFQSENFVVFWGEKAGTDPSLAPESIRFIPSEVTSRLEDIFRFFSEKVGLVPADKGNMARYKFIVVMNETWNPLSDGTEIFTGWAFGGSYESTIGAMWVHPKAADRFTLAHEFTHAMDNMVSIEYPGHGFVGLDYVGSFWETHANFVALLANPDRVESTDPARFLNTQHFYFSSARHHYTNWMLLQYIFDTDGIEMINRMWRESVYGEHPLQTLTRIKGLTRDGLNELIHQYAIRTVTFDFSNGAEIRKTVSSETDWRYISRRFTIPEAIDASKGRYRVPIYMAPQDYGYNIVRIHPSAADPKRFSIKFRGHGNTASGGAGWKTGFVFVKADGSVRYSTTYDNDFETLVEMADDETETYMVVSSAPVVHHNYAWEPGWPKIYRYPWEIKLTGAFPDGYEPGHSDRFTGVPGSRHPNGGGFVASTAYAATTAYVGVNAAVTGNARVTGNAVIGGMALVTDNASVGDNASVDGWATVSGNARLTGNSRVTEMANVSYGTVVSGSATVRGGASAFHSELSSAAILKDNASVWGATLGGTIVLGGDAEHFSSCSQGVYLQVWNLGNRGCDGLSSHNLNADVNPPFSDFTDPEMGIATYVNVPREPESRPYSATFCQNGYSLEVCRLSPASDEMNVSLFDLNGRMLFSSPVADDCLSLNTGGYRGNIFILVVETTTWKYSEKIIRLN